MTHGKQKKNAIGVNDNHVEESSSKDKMKFKLN